MVHHLPRNQTQVLFKDRKEQIEQKNDRISTEVNPGLYL